MKFRLHKARKEGGIDVFTNRTLRDTVIFDNYFDQDANIFLSMLTLPNNAFGLGETVLRLPEGTKWEELEGSRYEAKFLLAGNYPTTAKFGGANPPRIEVVFNQRGLEFRTQWQRNDPTYFL